MRDSFELERSHGDHHAREDSHGCTSSILVAVSKRPADRKGASARPLPRVGGVPRVGAGEHGPGGVYEGTRLGRRCHAGAPEEASVATVRLLAIVEKVGRSRFAFAGFQAVKLRL
jgi:hypothetical protein